MKIKKDLKNQWDSAFDEGMGTTWYPSEDLIRFTSRFLKKRVGIDQYKNLSDCKRILDLGCGNGRHVVYFAQLGFDAYGMDISQKALDICAELLSREQLSADLRCGDVTEIPHPEQFFDAVVSWGVLDHVKKDDAFASVREIKRVLTPGGWFHVNLRSKDSFDYGEGDEIEPGTFVLTEGWEKGLFQHFWDEDEIDDLLKDFDICNFELEVRWFGKEKKSRDSRFSISAKLKPS